MELKAGTRLRSTACASEVIVVRAPAGDVDLQCGGHPMVRHDDPTPANGGPDPSWASGTALGKRYTDEAETIEVLCTKAGSGSLSCNGSALAPKAAKPLPSSD